MKIKAIRAREIYNSRGIPTLECMLMLEDGHTVISSVPSGSSIGKYEAVELRDGGVRLIGMGVKKAVENIEHIIAPELVGKEPSVVRMDIRMLELDDTDNKSHLGANAILAVSIAVCKAQAYVENLSVYELIAHLCEFEIVSIPGPMFNVINGGAHANNNLQVQEFMLMPIGMNSFQAAMELGATLYQVLKGILIKKGFSVAVGDEGGFAPNFKSEEQALDCLMEAIEQVEGSFDGSVMIALDIAASGFFDEKKQQYHWQGKLQKKEVLIEWYKKISKNYPIFSIEDPFSQNDWESWHELADELNLQVKLVGDDIFATDAHRIWNGIQDNIAQSVIIKPNQVGTLTETLQSIKLCKEHEYNVIVAHRSGETNDSFIADLAVGVSADQIKAGACARGERIAKYNRLLAIEQDLLMTY